VEMVFQTLKPNFNFRKMNLLFNFNALTVVIHRNIINNILAILGRCIPLEWRCDSEGVSILLKK